ncbi:MAG: NTP transferase domain-containing protein [Marivibrio sp.]|uniref:cytidylyltransferase domain-containing protein n=1 Tax=Marivibrio sp. TaxID=2039719 RepID=UPI0032EEC18F
MKALGVLQARMGSSRVPGKAMTDLAGEPLIGHMIRRMRAVRGVGEIVLATTTDPRNDPLVDYCASLGVEAVRHPKEDDLAGRIALAIRGRPGRTILKTGGDCPFIDPAVLQRMVDAAEADPEADFISNRVEWSYPLGLSADVVSRRAIEWADSNLTAPEDRELFALWIRDHPERFKVVPIVHDVDLSHHNWCVDTPEDLAFARRVFSSLYAQDPCFGMEAVLRFLGEEGAAGA